MIHRKMYDASSVPYSTSKGLLCNLVHIDVELLLSSEVAVQYMFI